MKIIWTKGVGRELSIDIKQNFKESLVLRRRLEEILKDKIEESCRTARSKASYDNPNWAYMQADHRGYERAFQEVISLLNDEKVDKE